MNDTTYKKLDKRLSTLEKTLKTFKSELTLLRELENVVRFDHGRQYWTKPGRDESDVLDAIDKLRRKAVTATPRTRK